MYKDCQRQALKLTVVPGGRFREKEPLEAKGERGRLQIGQCGNSEAKYTQLGIRQATVTKTIMVGYKPIFRWPSNDADKHIFGKNVNLEGDKVGCG